MKLLRLKIESNFRSLQAGFELKFLRENGSTEDLWDLKPYCLVGNNGSGKSNVLELLAAIFYHIEAIYLDYKPEGFEGLDIEGNKFIGFQPETCYPDSFELEYLFYIHGSFSRKDFGSDFDIGEDVHIKIAKLAGERPQIFRRQKGTRGHFTFTELERTEVKKYLPEFIVAYSSGENQILSLPFFKMRFIQYEEYLDRLTRDLDYKKPESRFVYLDTYFNQAILLSIFLLREESLKPFFEEIDLEGISSFRIILRQHWEEDVNEEIVQSLNITDINDARLKRELTSKISDAIQKLISCSTTKSFNPDTKEWYLDYFVDEQCRKAFKKNFQNDALELFSTLQILLNLNLYQLKPALRQKVLHSTNIFLSEDVIPVPYDEERIIRFKELVLKKKNNDSVIYTRSLSDGEYQLIHSIGLCLLFRDTDSLIMLDEPETHFNPQWRSKFISILTSCLDQSDTSKDNRRELLITSHSPFIVSDCHPENVIIFEKQHNKVVTKTALESELNTFGSSVNLITYKIFGKQETISDTALRKIEDYRKMYREGGRLDEVIGKIDYDLGDSVEKTMLINYLLDLDKTRKAKSKKSKNKK
jgi:restriction system-associated AAA family ATPase